MTPEARSFPPVATRAARVLVLGSMPGVASLEAQQYYAHPRNAFWWLMDDLFGVDRTLPYPARTRVLAARGVALWDVLAACRREGSLDSAIERDSIVPNDLAGFLADHPRVRALCFNGRKAREVFDRHVAVGLGEDVTARVALHDLPSTSPAHARMGRKAKRDAWSVVRDLVDGTL